jgi:hypothetical protein
MSKQVKEIIRMTVMQMLEGSMSPENIRKITGKHEEKVHFVPIRYRIMGGILQGLNIKFGNFIEQLLRNIIEIDASVKVMEDSGKKLKLFFTHQTDALIDTYITDRQLSDSPDDWKKYWQSKARLLTSNVKELQKMLMGYSKQTMV